MRGKQLREQFLNNTPALKSLRHAVDNAVKSKGTLKAIDGRILPVRHSHAALNTLLQSAGAIMCKMWVVKFHKNMKALGYVHGVHYWQAAFVHDELQIRVCEKTFPISTNAEGKKTSLVGEICVDTIRQVGIDLGVRIPLDGEYQIGSNYADTH